MSSRKITGLALLCFFAGCGGDDRAGILRPPPTATSSATRTPTATPTPTPTPAPGANVVHLGLLRADNTLLEPSGFDEEGRPIYERPIGSGFVLVVEARRGSNGAPPGLSTFEHDPGDPSVRPDLQVQVNRDIGNGSPEVCDAERENFGGVPGIDPPSYELTQRISDALNDLGCRFVDGQGSPRGRFLDEACVLFPDGEFRFVDPTAEVEFCATVARGMAFPTGDTIVTARVRDTSGILGPARQIVVRVGATD
ncbi:MAG: hypothetical protein KatS3mg076_3017 [Candidatus Binatia bacterium]|nr:MAG: hypothetical protein KatS3mg076_3017 [Candidatus Binatia bacterium]